MKLDQFEIVKYGTSTLDMDNIQDQGGVLSHHQSPIALVSSGAVRFGGPTNEFQHIPDEIVRKQVMAMRGNPILTGAWDRAIRGKTVLQGLSTHRDFMQGASIQSVSEAIYCTGRALDFILMLNENDFASDEELAIERGGQMGDNDQNAVSLAKVSKNFSKFVRISIGTESGGFYTDKGEGELVEALEIDEITESFLDEHCGPSSNGGSEKGMRGKLEQAVEAIKADIDEVWIFDGANPGHLGKIFNGGHAGTKIIKSHNLTEI